MHLNLNREPIAFKKLAPLLMESDPSVRCVDLSHVTLVADNDFCDLREWTSVLRTQNHVLTQLHLGELRERLPKDDLHELDVMLALNAQPRTLKDLVLRVYENDPGLTEVSLVEYESTLVGGGGNSYRYRRRYDDRSVELLAEALRFNRHVTNLNLACNRIGDAGAVAVAEMLRTNRAIGTLSLANNHITDAGFMAIADALLTNPTLQCVVVDNNPIKDPMTRKHLNMATSHNAMVGATVYSTVDTTNLNASMEKELDDAVMADAISDYKAPARSLKNTMEKHGEKLLVPTVPPPLQPTAAAVSARSCNGQPPDGGRGAFRMGSTRVAKAA
eukprot:gene10021-33507_t